MRRFTIVTITYNAERMVGRTLDSVLSQTYEGVEHLIIDGASKDQTLALVEDYKRRSDESACGHKVIIQSEPDHGIYDAMNKGLSQASGDYIVYMNAGDFFPSNDTLEQIARRCRLNETPSAELPAVLYGQTDIVDNEGKFLHPRRLQAPERLTWRSFRQGMLVCHQAFYARTDLAKNLQYDTTFRYSADVDWCIRVMREGERAGLPLYNIGIVVANYTEEGTTTQHHKASLRERYRVMVRHYGSVQTFLLHCWFVVRSIFMLAALLVALNTQAQTYDSQYQRPLSDVMQDVAKRFKVKFRFDMDTTGLTLPYADFRIRPYSLEQTLTNICKYYDWNWWPRNNRLYRISRYEYYRRHPEEGQQMLDHLSTLYNNKEQWEQRRDLLRREVRQRLGIDAFLDSCVKNAKPLLSKVRKHDGYTTQNICIELTPGQHLFGTIYAPIVKKASKSPSRSGEGKRGLPLIICPDGHWQPGRFRDDEQTRLATLARMGAVCADFDLYGWGQSASEVGEHAVSRSHVFQAACSLRLLEAILSLRSDIDPERIGVCGGSGGGTHTVLLALLDDRIKASAPVVHVASHFDGGCPCESGMPVHLAGGGTCEPELACLIAPRPLLLVSDGGDWTSTTPEIEMPFMRRIYSFYGAESQIRNVHLPNERHDFGPSKRQAVYDFFIDVFGLDRSKLDESKVTIQSEDDLQFH